MPQDQNHKSIPGFQPKSHSEGPNTDGVNYLYAVAIDEYADDAIPDLHNAVKDVVELKKVLTDQYQFDTTNTYTLLNQDATEANILTRFRMLAEKITPADNLIIYFSGHGEYDKVFKEGYWIPTDAKIGATQQYITNSKIRTILNAIKAKHTFLIVDSCFSGSLFAQYRSAQVAHRLERDPSRWGLTSGRNEIVVDGAPGDNSPFAESLLYHLKNSTEPLGVQELCNKVIEEVITSPDQTPQGEPLKVDGHKGGQFFFHPKGSAPINTATPVARKTQTATTTQSSATTAAKPSKSWIPIALVALFGLLGLGAWAYFASSARKAPLVYELDKKFGYQNKDGDVVIVPQYQAAAPFSEGLAAVKKDYKWGYINRAGSPIIKFQFDDAFPFQDGMALVYSNGKSQQINQQGSLQSGALDTKTAVRYYNFEVSRGNELLQPPNEDYKQAKTYFTNALATAKGFAIDVGKARDGLQRCENLFQEDQRKNQQKSGNAGFAQQQQANQAPNMNQQMAIPSKDPRLKAGKMTDSRDKQTYKTLSVNGIVWMAQNLNFKHADSYQYEQKSLKGKTPARKAQGRLYTWETAQKICPKDWHLPTDKEWKNLATAFGGYYNAENQDRVGDPQIAYEKMLEQTGLSFSVIPTGLRLKDGSYDLAQHAFYWTSTRQTKSAPYYYFFDKGFNSLTRAANTIKPGSAYACRCVQNRRVGK